VLDVMLQEQAESLWTLSDRELLVRARSAALQAEKSARRSNVFLIWTMKEEIVISLFD
jgi:hypothetical protein